jgi:hypothetical protein
LLATPCFSIAIDGEPGVDATTGVSLKQFWSDGGASYFRTVLALGGPQDHWVSQPASIRRALTLETAPGSTIAYLLCPIADETCGAETEGWAERATTVFGRAGEIDHFRNQSFDGQPPPRDSDCEARAEAVTPDRRYEVMSRCLRNSWFDQTVLPIGKTRAPRDGWLIISGRRGHYDFCDETSAYDLESGGAYRISSCSALALQPGGSVDVRKTDRERRLNVGLGHLPRENLREAGWMILLLDEVDEHVHPYARGQQLRPAIEIMRGNDESTGSVGWSVSGGSTAETTLTWRFERGGAIVKHGTLINPSSDHAANAHAMQLLRIAEAGFAAGCPESPPPPSLLAHPAALSANKLDTDSTSLTQARKALDDGWPLAIARQQTCRRGPPAATVPKGTPMGAAQAALVADAWRARIAAGRAGPIGTAWSQRLTPPLPIAWPPAGQGQLEVFAYAARPGDRISDGEETAAPWARIRVLAGAPKLDDLGELQRIGIQGVRPLSADEIAIVRSGDEAAAALARIASARTLPNDASEDASLVRRYFCLWRRTNGVIATALAPAHAGFFAWLGCK